MAYNQVTTATNTNSKGDCHSSKVNRMHPYLELIHSREPMFSLSVAVESLLNHLTDSQANSYQQLADSLFLNNISDKRTIAASSADHDTITSIFATKGTSPLSTVSSPDHMLGDSARPSNCSMSHAITKVTSPQLPPDTSAGTFSLFIETHHFNNDRQHSVDKDKDRDMDKDTDTAPLTSDPTIAEEPDTASSLDKVAVKKHGTTSTESTPTKTNAQPIFSNIAGSISSSSYKESKDSSTFRESKNPLSPSTPSSLSPSSSACTFAQLQPLLVKYNADNNLTLSDFVRQLKGVFDCNPVAIMRDADRVKFCYTFYGNAYGPVL
ncbi:hypothetical protein BGZ47_011614 [Haplosporangium gracile]|nr:hypothetical protein BGZ47_011614 [Haplosporangium gracile]